MQRRLLRLAGILSATIVGAGASLAGASASAGTGPRAWSICLAAEIPRSPRFLPPVRGPAIQRFVAPANRFAAGHRGIDFGVPAATEVRAAGEGRVVFAGPVALDGLFVTVSHGQGLQTTYSFLSERTVTAGDRLMRGQILGRSGNGHPGEGIPSLHFGVRVRGEYVDPEAFLVDAPTAIALVPFHETPEASPDNSRRVTRSRPARSSRENARSVDRAFARLGGVIARTLGRLRQLTTTGRQSNIGEGPASNPAHRSPTLAAGQIPDRTVETGVGCTDAAGTLAPHIPTPEQLRRGAKAPRAPNENLVIALAGVGSSTSRDVGGQVRAHAALYEADLSTLGFSPSSIFYFSYRGIERRPGAGPYRFHAPYSKKDTLLPIQLAARKLDRQIQEIHRLYPDRKVDLVAHSQGGLVAQYFLERLYHPEQGKAIVDHFVSIATPHRGSDLAQLHRVLSRTGKGRIALTTLDRIAVFIGLPPPTSLPVSQMAEGSRFLRQLALEWRPSRVKTTTIAATFDLVVPGPRTRLEGATHYTADLPFPTSASSLWAHSHLLQTKSAKQILYNALADIPSQCTRFRNFLAAAWGHVWSGVVEGALAMVGLMLQRPSLGA